MNRILSILVVLTALLVTQGVWSQVPNTMSYQGVLHDGGGGAVSDGNYNITFTLYDVASGGSALWSETQSVTVQGGIFSVTLGSVTTLNLPFDNPYWLGVTVEGNPEFTPRRALTSSAYSMTTKSVENGVVRSINSLQDDITLAAGANVTITVSSDTLTIGATSVGDNDWTVSGDNMYSNVSGNVGIGTANPSMDLHIYKNENSEIGIRIQNPNTGDSARQRISFDNEEGQFAFIQIWGSGATGGNSNRMDIANNRSGGKINLITGGSPKLTISSTGNVGIGPLFPTRKLQVDGTIESMSGGFRFPDGSTQTTAYSAPQEVYFSVKRDAAYDWPANGTSYQVDLINDTAVWGNVGGGFEVGTGRFVAPVSGIYTFHAGVLFDNIDMGSLIRARLRIQSKNYVGIQSYTSGTSESVTVSITTYLAAGHIVELWAFVNDATPPTKVYGNTADYAFTYFTGALVR